MERLNNCKQYSSNRSILTTEAEEHPFPNKMGKNEALQKMRLTDISDIVTFKNCDVIFRILVRTKEGTSINME